LRGFFNDITFQFQLDFIMIKLIIGFIVIALYLLSKGGGNLDMGGEKHGADTVAPPAATAPAAAASETKH
jgi:L-asparagine transporter-like permease